MKDAVEQILKHPIATGILIGTTAASIIRVIQAIEKLRVTHTS